MTPLVRNTLTYGAARFSRILTYALVAWWFGLSASADFVLLALAVTLYVVNLVARVLGEVMVHRLRAVPFGLVLGLVTGGLVCWVPVSFFLNLSSFLLFAICAALLSGILAGRGSFLIPPVAALGSSAVLIGAALLVSAQPSPVVLIRLLVLSEGVRVLGLLLAVWRVPRIPVASLRVPLQDTLWHLGVLALFALPPVLARGFATVLGEGQVAAFSYASAGSGYLVLAVTAGLVVTKSYEWRGLGLDEIARRVLRSWDGACVRLGPLSLLLFAGLLLGFYVMHFELLLVTAILSLGLIFHVGAFVGYTGQAVLRRRGYVLGAAIIYTSFAAGSSWAFMEAWGLVGLALGLTLGQALAAGLLLRPFVMLLPAKEARC